MAIHPPMDPPEPEVPNLAARLKASLSGYDDTYAATASYRTMRLMVGALAFALPIVLVVGDRLHGGLGRHAGSISAYYYTHMRSYLVGTLCALAVFFFSYKYQLADNYLSDLAAIGALGVAFFPTNAHDRPKTWVTYCHYTFATLLFLTLSVFCLVVFTKRRKTANQVEVPAGWPLRQNIYRACGIVIILALVLSFAKAVSLFIGETLAIYAFALSWLLQGIYHGD